MGGGFVRQKPDVIAGGGLRGRRGGGKPPHRAGVAGVRGGAILPRPAVG
jgi:hypothetical protein